LWRSAQKQHPFFGDCSSGGSKTASRQHVLVPDAAIYFDQFLMLESDPNATWKDANVRTFTASLCNKTSGYWDPMTG
jgi:hypothetical protein